LNAGIAALISEIGEKGIFEQKSHRAILSQSENNEKMIESYIDTQKREVLKKVNRKETSYKKTKVRT
jgi:hypothetical protein